MKPKRRSGKKKTDKTLTAAHKAKVVKNLKPWKPGQSGNPNGRPKSLPPLERLVKELLGEMNEEDDDAGIKKVLRALLTTAVDSKNRQHAKAAEMLIDRAYGKMKDNKHEAAEEDKPKQIIGFNIKRK